MSRLPVEVIGWDGVPRDLAYLRIRYGDFQIVDTGPSEGAPAFWVSKLVERADGPVIWRKDNTPDATASLVVRIVDENGAPVSGVHVAFYWPDAPEDPAAGGLGRCVNGWTGNNGDVGFGMGPGAFYWPSQNQIGPHAVWIYGQEVRGELVNGLGMVALTNHYHFDVEYTLVQNPGGGDPLPVDLEAIEDKARRIKRLSAQIVELVQAAQGG